ncbi:MAG TPA: universal stress protein [Geomobilimonas sp.]|nr:universal stress protein [Geomobilimonas sp.]
MKFKDILVHLDSSPQSMNRLDLAIRIAKDHGARLTGLYVVVHPQYRPEKEDLGQRITEIEKTFLEKTAGEKVESCWICADWPVVGLSVVEVVNYYAHAKDLVVVGQATRDQTKSSVPLDLAERVILGAGRPVLVVPYAGSFPSVGGRVIVAWRPGRASARAVNDAMPFLAAAREVCLLEIRPPDGQEEVDGFSPKADIVENLRCHGIKVTEERLVTGNITVANILMNYAWENGCDLIVMGASTSGKGTVSLGAVAHQMLDLMTLPVLLAH